MYTSTRKNYHHTKDNQENIQAEVVALFQLLSSPELHITERFCSLGFYKNHKELRVLGCYQ